MINHSPFVATATQNWIYSAAKQGTLPHSVLFWGQGDLMALATLTARAYQCENGGACGVCPACEKVEKGIHPDVIVVEDAGHKMIAVDVVRQMRQSAFVHPNEGKRKVYMFPDASLLTPQDQNVLLKLVEEGPQYCAFVFCVANPDQVLQTLRSRCVMLHVEQASQEQVQEPSPLAVGLCRALLGKKGALTAWAVDSEGKKPTRQDLEQCLQESRMVCVQALVRMQTGQLGQSGLVQDLSQGVNLWRLSKIIDLLQHYYTQCAYNIGVNHTLGALAIELEEIP